MLGDVDLRGKLDGLLRTYLFMQFLILDLLLVIRMFFFLIFIIVRDTLNIAQEFHSDAFNRLPAL